MSGTSTIEWTEATWNPVTGCTHVSEGCDNCYAAREASGRLSQHPAYKGLAKDGKFTGEVRLLPDRLDQPLRWRRPRMVFVNSMSDLFHDAVPESFVLEVFRVMATTPRHIFQILTKRPGPMASLLSRGSGFYPALSRLEEVPWPLPNVWIGTSVETQRWADIRIPKLLETPAAVRFLSCEPLLGPLDLGDYLGLEWMDALGEPGTDQEGGWGQEMFASLRGEVGPRRGLHWIIVGGESGGPRERSLVECQASWYGKNAGYRWRCRPKPEAVDWVRSLRDQAVAADVPFFFKQWGGRTAKAGGRELDGRTWNELPDRAQEQAG